MSPSIHIHPALLRSAACLPLAAGVFAGTAALDSALSQSSPARGDLAHGLLHVPAWTFFHENVLGTSMQLTLRTARTAVNRRAVLHGDLAAAANAEAAVLDSIDRDALVLSAWRNDSEFSRWLSTVGQPVPVSTQLLDVLALFDQWRQLTLNALNPAAEAAVRLRLAASAELRQPNPAELAQTVAAIRQPHWRLDPDAQTATHLTSTPLALASFTKGYIAHRAAAAAMASGASGVTLNIGGDIIVRGDLAQTVHLANPLAHSENDAPIDRILLRDRAIATSGAYRRTLVNATPLASAPQRSELQPFSHIIDPRTATPTGHILSSTVIADDAITAGALATAFSVLTPDESHAIARTLPGVDYLLLTRSGERIASAGWSAYQAPALHLASYSAPSAPQSGKTAAAAAPAAAAQAYELSINLEIAGPNDFRYRRPYVAVWVENEDHYPVRTIALWYNRDRWLPDLRSWYRDDQLRMRMEGGSVPNTVTSATRPPGHYALKWDGKDNHGNPVKPGKYTIYIEAAREHGGYDLFHQEIDLNGQPQQHTLAPGNELGAVTLDYHKQ